MVVPTRARNLPLKRRQRQAGALRLTGSQRMIGRLLQGRLKVTPNADLTGVHDLGVGVLEPCSIN
jgi:hypothetical protein